MLSTHPAYQRITDLRSITVTKGNAVALANAKETAALWEAEHGKKVEVFEVVPVPVPDSRISQSVLKNLDRADGVEVNHIVLDKRTVDFRIRTLTREAERIVEVKNTISQYHAKMEYAALNRQEREEYEGFQNMLASLTYSHGEIEDVREMLQAYADQRTDLLRQLEALKGTHAYAAWTRNYAEDGTIL